VVVIGAALLLWQMHNIAVEAFAFAFRAAGSLSPSAAAAAPPARAPLESGLGAAVAGFAGRVGVSSNLDAGT
jgi:hypothetical protein